MEKVSALERSESLNYLDIDNGRNENFSKNDRSNWLRIPSVITQEPSLSSHPSLSAIGPELALLILMLPYRL